MRKQIERMNGHKAGVVWFTGLPGSGKSTLAVQTAKELLRLGLHCMVLDGDSLRLGVNRDLGFSGEDRMENIRRATEIALMFVEAGFIVLAPLISPTEKCRAIVRQRLHRDDYTELQVKCSIEECMRRDPKGMYSRAKAGEIPHFTGISSPYEPSLNPHLVIDTENLNLQQCVNILVDFVLAKVKLDQNGCGNETDVSYTEE